MLDKVRSVALDFLARREHSQFELENKLKQKNFVPSDIKEVLESLAAKGLQSDERFTESYIGMRSRKGFGPVRIKMELRERGIGNELADNFLSAADYNWFDLAKISRIKKFGGNSPVDLKEKARQIRYLNYKGFVSDCINEIFKW